MTDKTDPKPKKTPVKKTASKTAGKKTDKKAVTNKAATKSRPARKPTAAALHANGDCGCSITANPNNCVYQPFIDGWDFTPDVGNGKKRGEIFTPRFIVDKMIRDVGLFTSAVIDDLDYSANTDDELLRMITARVLEPAVGTGNYSSTILWHKISCAGELAGRNSSEINNSETKGADNNAVNNSSGDFDLRRFHELLLTAVGSVYAFDIDCGNIEVTRRRFTRNTGELNSKETVDYWETALTKSLGKNKNNGSKKTIGLAKTSKSSKKPLSTPVLSGRSLNAAIHHTVVISLNAAENHWISKINDSGVIPVLYEKFTGKTIPVEIERVVNNIVEDNLKLFNGIVEDDTIGETFVVAGWSNVVWCWWDFSVDVHGAVTESRKLVPLAEQIHMDERKHIESRIAELKKNYLKSTGMGLFEDMDMEWISSDAKKEFEQLEAKLESFG